MEPFFTFLLVVHVLAGSCALLSGTLALILKKGDERHKLIGRFFKYGMYCSGFSGMVMGVLHPNFFLVIVGVFTLYMVFTGQRALFFMKTNNFQKPEIFDKIVLFTMFLFALAFLVYGGSLLYNKVSFGIVLLVFGGISLLMVYKDAQLFKNKNSLPAVWLALLIQRIIGSYIAATTAFLVVNNTLLPDIVAWLLPTFLITPLLIYWSRKVMQGN